MVASNCRNRSKRDCFWHSFTDDVGDAEVKKKVFHSSPVFLYLGCEWNYGDAQQFRHHRNGAYRAILPVSTREI